MFDRDISTLCLGFEQIARVRRPRQECISSSAPTCSAAGTKKGLIVSDSIATELDLDVAVGGY